ncbi:hypothetical protein F5888DRAFT_679223 [Russula emetica]|nr:hypothetical protein F5888DRAFT_679223 [Russula emetica]
MQWHLLAIWLTVVLQNDQLEENPAAAICISLHKSSKCRRDARVITGHEQQSTPGPRAELAQDQDITSPLLYVYRQSSRRHTFPVTVFSRRLILSTLPSWRSDGVRLGS